MKKEHLLRQLVLALCLLLTTTALAQVIGKRMSETFIDRPMPEVLKTIGKKTGVRVQFAYEDVSAYKVSVKLTNATAEESVKKGGRRQVYSCQQVEGYGICIPTGYLYCEWQSV